MNTKLIVGFLAGILVATGVSYYAGHRAGSAGTTAVNRADAPVNSAVNAPVDPAASAPQNTAPEAPSPAPTAAVNTPVPPPPTAAPVPSGSGSRPATPPSAKAKTTDKPAARTTARSDTPSAPQRQAANVEPPAATAPAAPQAAAEAPQNTAPVTVVPSEDGDAPRRVQAAEPRVFRPDPPTPAASARREPSTVTIQEGTTLAVRLGEGLSTDRNRAGDEFTGTLDQALVVGDMVIAERGARVEGRVVTSERAGRVKGLAELSLELTKLHTADGQTVRIRTATFQKEAATSKKEDATKVGAGAAIGAIIGAIAGGGKGAAIGAGVGGAAGGGTVAATRGKPVELSVETRMNFRIQEPVTITERLSN
jgi:hypothetical protein